MSDSVQQAAEAAARERQALSAELRVIAAYLAMNKKAEYADTCERAAHTLRLVAGFERSPVDSREPGLEEATTVPNAWLWLCEGCGRRVIADGAVPPFGWTLDQPHNDPRCHACQRAPRDVAVPAADAEPVAWIVRYYAYGWRRALCRKSLFIEDHKEAEMIAESYREDGYIVEVVPVVAALRASSPTPDHTGSAVGDLE